MNANKQDAGGLPELPSPGVTVLMAGNRVTGYTADQMRAYGELCRAAPAGGDVLAVTIGVTTTGAGPTEIELRDSAPAGSGEVGQQLEMVEAYVRLYSQLTGHSIVVDLLNDYAALLRKLQQGVE